MFVAAMWRHRFFLAIKWARNDPETDLALPHRVFPSPQDDSHRNPGVGLSTPTGIGGVNQDSPRGFSYGRVIYVPPVVSCWCLGPVFGDVRRIGNPVFGTVSSRRTAF